MRRSAVGTVVGIIAVIAGIILVPRELLQLDDNGTEMILNIATNQSEVEP